jgi:hypothetical protein
MSDPSSWGFDVEVTNLLNRIANYGKDKGYSADELEQIFNAGIAARSVFLTHRPADTSEVVKT